MGISTSSFYGLTRTREMSPDARDWAATDGNFEAISLIMKAIEQHKHTGVAGIAYPGYLSATPLVPTPPTLSSLAGGTLTPGNVIGVRLSYVTTTGLETDASPETTLDLGAATVRPLGPTLNTRTAATPGMSGGTYVYVITKKKLGGETLPSDILPVDIPYDTNYSVTLNFSAINSYADGTDAINIYRAAGLNSQYQLVTTVTGATVATYVDNGTIPPANVNIQPPAVSTFNASQKVRINWAAITHPSGASKFRVYVTQQTGIFGTSSLLQEFDLAATPPTFVDYLGTESLSAGFPKNASQVPSSAPKLDLSTETIGAPSLTANQAFNGFQAVGMRLGNNTGVPAIFAAPDPGDMYYDTSINNIRAYINGAWVNWGTTAATAYTHPAQEIGGHVSSQIPFSSGSSVTAKTIFDTMRNSDGTQKHQTQIFKVTGPALASTASLTPAAMADMSISQVPTFTSQWAEALFSGHFILDTFNSVLTVAIEYDGSTIEETVRAHTSSSITSHVSFTIPYMVQMGNITTSKLFRVLWWVSAGTATNLAGRRSLTLKVLP